MVIFNSYVKLPEGTSPADQRVVHVQRVVSIKALIFSRQFRVHSWFNILDFSRQFLRQQEDWSWHPVFLKSFCKAKLETQKLEALSLPNWTMTRDPKLFPHKLFISEIRSVSSPFLGSDSFPSGPRVEEPSCTKNWPWQRVGPSLCQKEEVNDVRT